jgi:hypothetical protein
VDDRPGAAGRAAALVALGVVLLTAGAIDHLVCAPRAALCHLALGRAGQPLGPGVPGGCSRYAGAESLAGWLIAGGALALASAVALLLTDSRTRRDRDPASGPR